MQEKKYYPDVAYNRSRRNKFYMTLALLVVCMGLSVGAMIAIKQYLFGILFGVIIIFMFTLIPAVHKNYPIKQGVPQLVINNKEIIACGKTLKHSDIEKVIVNVPITPISKIESENKAHLAEWAAEMPDGDVFGNIDILLKQGPNIKKGETLYVTVDNCLGALTDLVSAGVKHYRIGFSMKKYYEEAKFSITKNEIKKQANLSDVSAKDRLKQLI